MTSLDQLYKASQVLSGILALSQNPTAGLHLLAGICAKLCDRYQVSRDDFCNTLKRTKNETD